MATILVADDRPVNRRYLVALLGHFGHRILEASSGAEALKQAAAERPDLVFTDMVMPEMDGHELAIRLRNQAGLEKVPVIFYSASYSVAQARSVAASVGAFGVLPKPCDPDELVEMVSRALGVPAANPQAGPEDGAPLPPQTTDVTFAREDGDVGAVEQRRVSMVEMSLEMTAESEPEHLLSIVAQMVRKLVGSKHVAVACCGESGAVASAYFLSGAGGFAHFTAGPPPPGTILARLLEERSAQRASGVEPADLGLELPPEHGGSGFESVLAAPLVYSGRLLGWILLLDKLGGEAFSAGDECVAATLAAEGALVYQRLINRRRTEESLRKSQAMFESLFQSSPDALLASDGGGRITQANAQAERMFDYRWGEVVGKPIEILVPERFRGRHSKHRGAYYAEPRLRPMGAGLELYGRRKDGTEFPIDIMLNSMPAEHGALTLSVVRDISARKAAEDRILQLNTQLQERIRELQVANDSLESFSYSVAHDLRAPLRAIDGFARLCVEEHAGGLNDEGQRLLSVIQSNARKMGELIDDLLNLSRVSRSSMAKTQTEMTALAQAAIQHLRSAEPDRQVQICLHPLPFAVGDAPLLRQVWFNLISNAWKFTSRTPNAMIEIGSRPEQDQTVYYVQDNGVGFDMQYSARLFGVFQRLHKASEFDGTGVGLALVRRIVDRHGGRVWADSKPGEGARFSFTL